MDKDKLIKSMNDLCDDYRGHFVYIFFLREGQDSHYLNELADALWRLSQRGLACRRLDPEWDPIDFFRESLTWYLDTLRDAIGLVESAFMVHRPKLTTDGLSEETYRLFQKFMNHLYHALPEMMRDADQTVRGYAEWLDAVREEFPVDLNFPRMAVFDLCAYEGNRFIGGFHRAILEETASECFRESCLAMQESFDKVKEIYLDYDAYMDFITAANLIDWFFTAGNSVDHVIQYDYWDIYEQLYLRLLLDRKHSKVEEILKELLDADQAQRSLDEGEAGSGKAMIP